MLRFLATACNIFGTLCVILSPISIIHWVLKGIKITGLEALDVVFEPMNLLLGMLIPIPPMQFGDQKLSIIPGILAFLLTFLFFIFSTAATLLRATEEKIDISKQTWKQQIQVRRAEEARKQELKKIAENKTVWLYMEHPMLAKEGQNSPYTQFFHTHHQYEGRVLQTLNEGWLLQFDQLIQAFNFAIQSVQGLTAFYATLRPMDPQPPVKMTMHATVASTDDTTALSDCRQLLQYTGNNEIIFSTEVKKLMDANYLTQYKVQSLGFYAAPGGGELEVYRLFTQKRH